MNAIMFVDCLEDFMRNPGNESNPRVGKLYIPGAEKIIPNLSSIAKVAKDRFDYTIYVQEAHFPDDPELQANGGPFPPHGMRGTYGARIISEIVSHDNRPVWNFPHKIGKNSYAHVSSLEAMTPLLSGCDRRIRFEKQTYDVFSNPFAEVVLKRLGIDEVTVCGVATEYCVKAAVLGLLERGIKTKLVTDAIRGIDDKASREALIEMGSKGLVRPESERAGSERPGAEFVETKEVIA